MLRRRALGFYGFAVVVVAATAMFDTHQSQARGRTSTSVTVEQRAAALVQRMTLDEKITALHGLGTKEHLRYVPGVSRLGIPPLVITNGPAGVGPGDDPGQPPATALPAPISLAASWDRTLAKTYGATIGDEARALGENLVEGPDVDIARVPQDGRTFEALGEDPYLAAQIAANEVSGIQSTGAVSAVKHMVGNNQETNRFRLDAIIAPRALREIYLPPFEAAVRDAHAGAVMCAFNRINHLYSCEDRWLLQDVLRREFAFGGFVMSDFGATHSTVAAAKAGLDLEMPSGYYFAALMRQALVRRQISVATIDRLLVRRYASMIRLGLFGQDLTPKPISAKAHGAFARAASEQGMVLLKNVDRELPLDTTKLHSIAVIGVYGGTAITGGGGSSRVKPLYTVHPVLGIAKRAGQGVKVSYAYAGDSAGIAYAAQLARSADVAILMVGDSRSEGADRTTLALPNGQDELVEAVARANPHTVVVVKSGGAVLMPWIDRVPAVLEAWYPGEEDGNAVAAILFGDTNPSGKLPITFPRSDAQTPGNTPARFPGIDDVALYAEGLQVGYRRYDARNARPLFPFGFGLSYTTFSLRGLELPGRISSPVRNVRVRVVVTNSGRRVGSEVVQVYVGAPPRSGEPPKQLKEFRKVSLRPGSSQRLTFTLDRRAFATWDVSQSRWAVRPGAYRIMIGVSSRDIRQQGTLVIR